MYFVLKQLMILVSYYLSLRSGFRISLQVLVDHSDDLNFVSGMPGYTATK